MLMTMYDKICHFGKIHFFAFLNKINVYLGLEGIKRKLVKYSGKDPSLTAMLSVLFVLQVQQSAIKETL